MSTEILERFRPLFEPRGIIIAGASSHPGKFGFVAAHNILSEGFPGEVFLTNRDGAEILGRQTLTSIDDVPEGAADLVFVCTPQKTLPDLLRSCAAKGVKAAFVTTAGYGELGEEGKQAEKDLVDLCAELDILLLGPNGQGVISTPAKLCAQIVAPFPPRGNIAIASQSGGFVQAFQNYAVKTGVGISRAVSAGNCAATNVEDYLEYFAADPETAVSLIYIEGIEDGRRFYDTVKRAAAEKPLVVLKGGATSGGQRAAASHTGALATDDNVFDGMCRQAGLTRATSVEEAFELAASFATHPLPRGGNVFVLTTAGGWGVVTADRITSSRNLDLMPIPDDLKAEFDKRLPPRWSRNNPADLAGSETRDTVAECLELVAGHSEVDSVLLLGVGIQSNLGAMERAGRFYPGHGLERIVEFHERQDTRYAQLSMDLEKRFDKPVLVATELVDCQSENAGPKTLRDAGSLAYASSYRAVTALEHLYRHSQHRAQR
ncbi:MAG: CoA-binding protein [Candidatus Binatia bacterium]|nr:CoA-binding protein [Candidatus Binatia bacterium]